MLPKKGDVFPDAGRDVRTDVVNAQPTFSPEGRQLCPSCSLGGENGVRPGLQQHLRLLGTRPVGRDLAFREP